MSNDITSVWGIPEASIETTKQVGKRFSLKHGMFAGVPIICKGELCKYKKVCTVPSCERIVDSRCIMEAGAIIERFDAWCRYFKVDIKNGKIKDEDLADVTLIKDLVENEVQTLRAENRIALNGDFIGLVISQIDTKGKVYREEAITPEAEHKLVLQKKKHDIMQLLKATRKDQMSVDLSAVGSEQAMSIFKKVEEKINNLQIDLDNIPSINKGE